MLGWMDSDVLRTAGYLAVAAAATTAGWRERRRAGRCSDLQPAVWFVVAGLFVVMAAGRAGDVGQTIADVGRRGARSGGWYERRRSLQELVVIALGMASFGLTTVLPLWVRAHRRHYLPIVLVTLAVMSFAAIRIVSLHQLDGLMHHSFLGTTIGTAAELAGLLVAAAVAITCWPSRPCQPVG